MPSREYLDHPGMNQSKLKHILFGVEQYKEYCQKPRKASPEQALGSAVHLLTFEPQLRDKIIILPKHDGKTTKGKIFNLLEEGKDPSFFIVTDKKRKKTDEISLYPISREDSYFMLEMYEKYKTVFAAPEDHIFLTDYQYHVAHRMLESLRENEDFQMLMALCSKFESTHFFRYKGIDFKAQTDGRGIRNNAHFILDLKTTSMPPMPVDKEAFKQKMWYQITNDFYDFQAACYLNTIEPDFLNDCEPIYYIVYVRSISPFQVYIVDMSEDLILHGKARFDKACDMYLECLSENPTFKANNRIIRV